MARTAPLLAMVAVAAALAASPSRADDRVALVVGEGGYKSVPALANPPNDARDVAQALASLGFKTTLLVDADRKTFERAVAEFGPKAQAADVSLFYYGGHGLQASARNYLLPVDAELKKKEDVEAQSLLLDKIMEEQTGGPGIHLIFLDACRNDPFKLANLPQHAAGLARTGNAPGFLIAYATQPDNVALDGAGRNSPFAQSLLSHLATPGLDVSGLMIQVRRDVISATGSLQVPWENSSLTRQFYFAGDAEKATPETLLWALAGEQHDSKLAAIYLERFPKGPHAEDVRALLNTASLGAAPKSPDGLVEEDLWRLALSARDRSLARLYLDRYPQGAYAKNADELLASLESADTATANAAGACEKLATHPSDATANIAGVDFATLAAQSARALEACAQASRLHPENPHYVALLARATFAAGRQGDAVALFRKAADAGDMRAMVSLATLMENGDHAPKNLKAAYALYEQAAARHFPDADINLGVALYSGAGIPRDVPRAMALFREAANLGSARATYNLAKMVSDGVGGAKPGEAVDLFLKAADLGYPDGYRAAALLLDEGRVAPRNADSAADHILQCVRADFGDCAAELTGRAQLWKSDTVRAIQQRLKTAGYYDGQISGVSGPALAPALQKWRLLGPPKHS